MSNSIMSFINIKLNKKEIIIILGISFLITCLYSVAVINKKKSYLYYVASLELPATSQGEIPDLYRRSPFKELRITFPPAESFSKADFLITANRENATIVGEMLLKYLNEYYKGRKPYPSFVEHDLENIKKLQEKLAILKLEVKNELEGMEILKKRYHNYHLSAFLLNETQIIQKELQLITIQHELDALLESTQLPKIKLADISLSSGSLSLTSLVIKSMLIFISMLFLQLLLNLVWINKKSQTLKP